MLDQLPENQESACILLDMLMPDVNGLALQERLKKVGSALPIVFMTGSVERIERGTEDLLKSHRKEKLLDVIERALRAIRWSRPLAPDMPCYLVREKDYQNVERLIKTVLARLRRLRDKRLVVVNGQILTAFRASKRQTRRSLRNTSERDLNIF